VNEYLREIYAQADRMSVRIDALIRTAMIPPKAPRLPVNFQARTQQRNHIGKNVRLLMREIVLDAERIVELNESIEFPNHKIIRETLATKQVLRMMKPFIKNYKFGDTP